VDISILEGGFLSTDDIYAEEQEHEQCAEERVCKRASRSEYICAAGQPVHTDKA
jgi:hypothetical protein